MRPTLRSSAENGRTARETRAALVLGLLLLPLGLTACGPAGDPPRQVILLLLDAARPDRFSSYGYTTRATTPEMDRLAAAGVIFKQHYTQGTGTRVSIPALLYSRYYSAPIFPNDPQVPYSAPINLFRRPDDEQVSFVKAFEAAGFKTAAISAHLWTGEETPFATEFMEMHDLTTRFTSEQYPYPRARGMIDFAIGWIDEHQDEDFFLYLHLMDTHYPHFFEADAQEYFGAPSYDAQHFIDGGNPKVPSGQLSADDLRYIDALYDGSLRYTDRHVGRLFEFLREESLLENATIAITSDHGEHLLDGPGGRPRSDRAVFSHGGPWLEPVARLPLILYDKDRLTAGRFEGLSEEVDLGPTLLALADVGVPTDKKFDGIALSDVIAGTLEGKTEAVMHRSIRAGKYKAIFSSPDTELLAATAPAVERLTGRLYDLEADPGEHTNLFAERGDVVADLLERYRAILRSPYQRAESATSPEQPSEVVAISVRYLKTDAPLPKLESMTPPIGWSLAEADPHSVLIAHRASEPLDVRLRIPNGRYRLYLGMMGKAEVEVDGERRDLDSTEGMSPFGEIEVQGETFRARLQARPEEISRIFYFGFIPPGASLESSGDDERTRRLRALGYIQ